MRAQKRETKNQSLAEELEGGLTLQGMITGNRSKYLMVNLISQRARDLNDGARPLVSLDAPYTHLEMAIAEGAAGVLNIVKKGEKKEPAEQTDDH